ncbi:MAG: alpha/beta hydrolase family protein [Brevundimonas sp.]|uniref:alpha/beta hydrolase family protein n=1 Tax=Brevundimonas sp. TaxID=1871086 RepID=UPI00391933F4
MRYAHIFTIDEDGGVLQPLFPMDADAGYTLGAVSPNGRRAAVFRLKGATWRLGVADLRSGAVFWTGIVPETEDWGRALEWRDDERLVVVGAAANDLPWRLAKSHNAQAGTAAAWDAAARGEAAVAIHHNAADTAASSRTLWALDAVTGEARRLADGEFLDLELSHDGDWAALLTNGAMTPPRADAPVAGPQRRRYLTLVDLDRGTAVRPPAADDISPGLLNWSPVAPELLVHGAADGDVLRVGVDGRATVVDLGGHRAVTDRNFFRLDVPRAGWLGRRPLVWASDGQAEPVWRLAAAGREAAVSLAIRGRMVAASASRVFLADGETLTALGEDLSTEALGRHAALPRPDGPLGVRAFTDPMKAASAAAVQADGRLCRIAAADLRRVCIDEPAAPGAVRWGHGDVYRTTRRPHGPAVLEREHAGRTDALHVLNPHLAEVDHAEPVRVDAGVGGGGWLYLPTRPRGGGPAPMVVIPYQGDAHPAPPDEMAPGVVNLTRNGQLLTAEGYAVLFPDLPATPEPADRLADRILAVVDAAARDAPVDPSRIGLWGWSFGAWTSLMAAAQSDRFAAVAALNGAYDFPSVIGTTQLSGRADGGLPSMVLSNAGWLEAGQAAMGVPYWNDRDRYRRNSPFDAADRIAAPVLFLVGDLDMGVPQSEQMFGALYRLGRDPALIYFLGEEHSIRGPGNLRVMYDHVLDWFDRHLNPGAETPGGRASGAPRPR